jgi:hypothetical protein
MPSRPRVFRAVFRPYRDPHKIMSWLLWVPGPVNSPIVTTRIIDR